MASCSAGRALESLPKHQREKVQEAIDANVTPRSQLARLLSRFTEYRVSGWTLRAHARKDCGCE